MKNLFLFEYQNSLLYGTNQQTDALEVSLQQIWQKRHSSPTFFNTPVSENRDAENAVNQQFISINRQNYVKAKNYVGLIKQRKKCIFLLPKIFYQPNQICIESSAQEMQKYLLWWMQYSFSLQLPFTKNSFFHNTKGNLVEALIFLFAQYTNRLLQNAPYQQYELASSSTSFVKGSINWKKYIQQSIPRGQWKNMDCTYPTLTKDNLLNQIVKFVAKDLIKWSEQLKTKQLLKQIIHALDEVSDRPIEVADCVHVRLHSLRNDWEMVLQYCRLFLAQTTLASSQNYPPIFTFLINMNQLFEQFVYGFLRRHFATYQPQFQVADTHLATNKMGKPVFQLRHDILIQNARNQRLIIECKYKIIHINEENGQVTGIQQKDLYQVTTYAIRRACQMVVLVYPNHCQNSNNRKLSPSKCTYFDMEDRLSSQRIRVWIAQIPMIATGKSTCFLDLEKELYAFFRKLLQ